MAQRIHVQMYISRMANIEDVNIIFNLFFPYIKSKGIYKKKSPVIHTDSWFERTIHLSKYRALSSAP